jgi:integrase
LEDANYKKLSAEARELWFRTLVAVGRTYGWRIGELLHLRVKQVDLLASPPVIRLEPGTTKNKEGRNVSIQSRELRTLLAQCIAGKAPDDFVFTRPCGKPIKDFRGTWRTACENAGVPELLFHDLRRTAARNLRRSGNSEGVIMKIGGWKAGSVFDRYAIVSQSDIDDALAKQEEYEEKMKQAEREREMNDGHSSVHSRAQKPEVADGTKFN